MEHFTEIQLIRPDCFDTVSLGNDVNGWSQWKRAQLNHR
jgi:hypothetical protein